MMRIVEVFDWEKDSREMEAHGVSILVNDYDPKAEWVAEIASRPFGELAKRYPAEKRLFFAGEPSGYMNLTPEKIQELNQFYKGGIFAWHKKLLHLPQTKPFGMGGSWVVNDDVPKEFGVGGIFSGKNAPGFRGYEIRKKLIALDGKVKIPGMIYHPGKTWGGKKFDYPYRGKKDSLKFMFHLAIENCAEQGYFSEKLVDCFVSRSIPIYFGDPSIGDRFESSGIIVLDEKNMLKQINELTPELYESKKKAVMENQRRAEPYRDFAVNAARHILHYLAGKPQEGL
jgi:hypothetical protein